MENSLIRIDESSAKVLAATSMAKSLSFCTERKYLDGIGDFEHNLCFVLREVEDLYRGIVSWIEISQVGKPLSENKEDCFSAMQKILYSCFMPYETQLLFLILGNGIQSKMFLGVRPLGTKVKRNIVTYLNEFLRGVWPGLQTQVLKSKENEDLMSFSQDIKQGKLDCIYAITGIPSMESQYKSTYPATIDKLIAGMNKCKNYAYLVVADPVSSEEIENILYKKNCFDIMKT